MRTSFERVRGLAAFLVLLPTVTAAVGPPAVPDGTYAAPPSGVELAQDPLVLRLQEAAERLERGDVAAADPLLAEVVGSPRFASLPEELQTLALYPHGLTATGLGDLPRAWALVARANASSAPLPDALALGVALALDLEREADAIDLLARLADLSPETVQAFGTDIVYPLAHRLGEQAESAPLHSTLLETLYAARWRHPDGRQPSTLWIELAGMRLDAGDLGGAIAVAGDVTAPESLVTLAVEQRFAAVSAALPADRRDIGAAVERELAELRAAVEQRPNTLETVMELGYALDRAGLHAQMLEVSDAALRRLEGAVEAPPYDDADQFRVWIHDNRARALLGLGRTDEAVAAWEAARRLPGSGGQNVSQAINLASLYAALGRSEDAAGTLAAVGNASPFGWMQYHYARFVAFAGTPGHPVAAESLAYLREHAADAPGTATEAFVRAGLADEAATLLIARLDDPEQRSEALLDVQRWRPRTVLPDSAEVNARWDALVARPDVQAAIAKYGRVIDVPLLRSGF
jgi:tetratricopeptide (TPR) repeat protein